MYKKFWTYKFVETWEELEVFGVQKQIEKSTNASLFSLF
jgi:hypothetical protein